MRHDTHKIFQDHMIAEDLLREATTPEEQAIASNWVAQLSREYSMAMRYWWNL